MEVQSSDPKVLENSMESATESGLAVESMFAHLKESLFASFTVQEFLINPEDLMILNEKGGKTSVENSMKVGPQDRSECNNNTLSESGQWQGQMDAVEFSFEVDQSQTNSQKDVSHNTSIIGSPAAQSTQIDSSQNMSRNTRHSLRNRKENQQDKTKRENQQDKTKRENQQDKTKRENQLDKTTLRLKDKKSTCQKNITAWIQPDFTSGENSGVHEAINNDKSSPSKSADEGKLKDLEIRLKRVDDVYTFHSTASLNNKSNEKKSDKNHRTFAFTKTKKDNEKDTVNTDRTEKRNKDNGNVNQRTKEAWESMPSAALYLRHFEKT